MNLIEQLECAVTKMRHIERLKPSCCFIWRALGTFFPPRGDTAQGGLYFVRYTTRPMVFAIGKYSSLSSLMFSESE